MRLYGLLSAAAIIAALSLTACNSRDGSGSAARAGSNSSTPGASAPTTSMPSDGVRRITTAELRDALEKGTAIVIDVRSAESYKMGHVKGAQNIPEAEIASHKDELPRDKTIVLYCS